MHLIPLLFTLGLAHNVARLEYPTCGLDSWLDTGRCVGQFCLSTNPDIAVAVISTAANLRQIKAVVGASNTTAALHTAPIPGKGLGLVADTPLRRGTPIMARTPALVVHRAFMEGEAGAPAARLLAAAVDALPPAARELFLSQAVQPGGGSRAASIMATNSFQVDVGGPDGHHYANYPEVSRLNHDCRPNAAFFVGRDLAHTTTLARDVAAGEELTISYLDVRAPRAERKARARAAWGFECTCQQCSDPESDARLQEIGRIEALLSDPGSSGVTRELLRQFEHLHGEERLEAAAAGAYTLAALNGNMLGDEGLARRYAQLAAEAGTRENGPEAGDVRAMAELLANPRGHFTWGGRQRRP